VAARELAANGYQVAEFAGGLSEWIAAGLPVESG
jgi:rhodanese-related sulfurtransferase